MDIKNVLSPEILLTTRIFQMIVRVLVIVPSKYEKYLFVNIITFITFSIHCIGGAISSKYLRKVAANLKWW
jgi:hypothetical protein